MNIKNFFRSLIDDKPQKIITIDPEHLVKNYGSCKGYQNLKKTYLCKDLKEQINGRNVKHWKLVLFSKTDGAQDEYIPIFKKQRK